MARKTIAAMFALMLVSSVVHGQTASTTAGSINGTITDTTKAVLPGVTVTLSGPSAMGTPTTVTDQGGAFRLPNVAPGDYKLTFELTGFGSVTRESIHVSLGFTATVNVEMHPGSVAETVTVSGASPVVDLQSTNVTTHFDAEKLATLPGSRDFWGVLAQAPAVAMSRVDVGGSGALTQQPYTAYGLSSSGGVNRGEVEGVMVNEGSGGGGSDMYYTDYGSYAEIAVNAVGNTAEMPNPGVLSQLIAKSGGNSYHGSLYADFENDAMEAHNIDQQQIDKGLTGSSALSVNDLNRLTVFKDFDADLGGYVDEGPSVVVRCGPAHRHRPAISDARRRYAGHDRAGGHRQGHLQPHVESEDHRVLSARQQTSARLPRRDPDFRRPGNAGHHACQHRVGLDVSDERLEGRIQRRARQLGVSADARRPVPHGLAACGEESGSQSRGHRQQPGVGRRVRHDL